MALLPAARRCRLRVVLCALLTLWACFDSQVLLLAAPGSLPPASQNPSPSQDDDDDYVLDLTGQPCRALRRNARSPALRPHRPLAVTKPCLSLSCHRHPLPATPICEHENRNGIGAPLLC
jgi:hypothetical protein